MITPQKEIQWYVEQFQNWERQLNGERETPIHQLRQEALLRFQQLGFPTTRQEDWKYTNIKPIASRYFVSAELPEPHKVGDYELEAFSFSSMKCSQLVFINGRFDPKRSSLENLPTGVQIGSLAKLAPHFQEEWKNTLTQSLSTTKDAFQALNNAFWQDGLFIWVPPHQVIENPIYCLYYATEEQEAFAIHPKNLLIAGEASQVSLIEAYFGAKEAKNFTNVNTTIHLSDQSQVHYYRLQQESRNAFHLGSTHVYQSRNSRFHSHSISFGGEIGRHELEILLDREGAECSLFGLYFADGKQLLDNHTFIDHAKPHGTSQELYKGIVADQARAVFSGNILVRKDAQKTDSRQTNKNLLLSEEAMVDTKPQLEIFADDVKCAHGATVGQIEKTALFYLRSRGISLEKARSILTYAFAAEILQSIPYEPIRQSLESALWQKLKA